MYLKPSFADPLLYLYLLLLSIISFRGDEPKDTSGTFFLYVPKSSSVNASGLSSITCQVATNGDNAINWINASSTYICSIVVNASSVSYNTSSDYRLKQDLKDFSGLNLVSNIKVYDYEWKIDNTRAYGVVAHELEEIIPQAVSGVKDDILENGEIKSQGVDYSKIVPILIKAIQEQQEQIDKLTNA